MSIAKNVEKLTLYQLQFSQALKDDSPTSKGMDVYRTGIRIRIEQSLMEDFPILTRVVGEETFSELVLDFLRNQGSTFASLSELGKTFVPFLGSHALVAKYPYLEQLAGYEWKKIVSSLSDEDDLKVPKTAPDETSKLQLNPSVLLWRGEWPVYLLEEEDANPALSAKSSIALIWSHAGETESRPLNPFQGAVLELIQSGATVGELGGFANAHDISDLDFAELFQRWVTERVISGWSSNER